MFDSGFPFEAPTAVMSLEAAVNTASNNSNNRVSGKRFEVGKMYDCVGHGFDPVEIIRRTAKMVTVKPYLSNHTWRMLIRIDKDGNEYLVDSTLPKSWQRFVFYSAKRVVP